MRLAVISTTFQGEKGYLPFDTLAKKSPFDEVIFVVAGDKEAKPFHTKKFQCPVEYLTDKDQSKYKSSEIVGWKKPQRRIFALLRAMELKPDYILTIDDDNIPDKNYFNDWFRVISRPAVQEVVMTKKQEGPIWHNYLSYTDAPIEFYPRGFPFTFRHQRATKIQKTTKKITPQRIGLFQGVSLGDPDIDAITRLVYPVPIPLKKLRKRNYCLKNIWCSYNTQNTLLTPKIFPLGFVWPFAGRHDDIFASFTWQKLLFNNKMYAHVGDPVNRQNRGTRDILNTDFKNETEGYFYAHEVWEEINNINAKDAVSFLEELTKSRHPIIARHKTFLVAYLKDVKKVI